ncbi:hypothetical protein GRI38_06520 [Altererythrobacter aurantiacus]|uniref:Uncharacterized protein n=1 Tax=Parapontixanthobacter aurantiacus TaxID=1463599 RepID=A0A844ZEJ2_9SPHN|nr:hypothetical protein [Parapontixanthobacter aurantiacus]MXO85683.1 hypothetical protein [Parapontixanthobacter aurantiacus]
MSTFGGAGTTKKAGASPRPLSVRYSIEWSGDGALTFFRHELTAPVVGCDSRPMRLFVTLGGRRGIATAFALIVVIELAGGTLHEWSPQSSVYPNNAVLSRLVPKNEQIQHLSIDNH